MLSDNLNYEPNELSFGTSGLRGLLSDMTDLECYINTRGFIDFMSMSDGTVYIAGDLRSSTPRIMSAVAKAIEDSGLDYENCGFIPTPAIALYSESKDSPCIMVTGSHIPDDRNGIKFYKADGEVLKADEAAIKESVAKVRKQMYISEESTFGADGQLVDKFELSDVMSAASNMYKSRFVDFFGGDSLDGSKIVMYQHSAVGRDLIPEILEAMGASVTNVDRSEAFIPIDTENVTPDDASHFRQIATSNPDCDAVISTDGDSDRPFVIDETGEFHRGDVLGVVTAQLLNADAAAFPISSNDAVVRVMEDEHVQYELTRIGSPYVVVAMQDLDHNHDRVVGWEVNGGFLTGSDVERGGKVLSPLPTRDALLPIVCAIISAKESGQKISELFAALPRRFTQAGMLNNFPNEVSAKIVQTLEKRDDAAEALIESQFTKELGFDEVLSIDVTDGIRIYFDNGDIAHLRPSGNAPQLRIYSNANSQERADEIVAQGVEEPSGILRSIESSI